MKLVKIESAATRIGITTGQVIELLTKNVITDGEIIDEEIYIPSTSIDYVNRHRDLLFNLNELYGVDAISCALKVSPATVDNWFKLKKLVPDRVYHGKFFCYRNTIIRLRDQLENTDEDRLKSRRNKIYKSGNEYYESYLVPNSPNRESISILLEQIKKQEISNYDNVACSVLLAECAIQLLNQRLGLWMNSPYDLLAKYLSGQIDLLSCSPLIDEIILNKEVALEFVNSHHELFQIPYYYMAHEDLLGCMYLSICSLSDRKSNGIYYTPRRVVNHLIEKVADADMLGGNIRYFDPCCGTGNFLINLPECIEWSQIRGADIDKLAVSLCRINVFLRSTEQRVANLMKRFIICDYLNGSNDFNGIDEPGPLCIMGNPPWGIKYTLPQKIQLCKSYSVISPQNCESFDLFIEKSIMSTRTGDCISLVLPQSLMNVYAHFPTRRLIVKYCSIASCQLLGEQFDGVSCPSMILTLKRESINDNEHLLRCKNAQIYLNSKENFVINQHRSFTNEFNLLQNNEEYALLSKIEATPDCTTLANQAQWAIGIVTGDNKGKLKAEKNKQNEPILKGINIDRYRINYKNINYIEFKPEEFQQVAKEEFYRAPEKLLYRFINKDLIIAYDDHKLLSLNSANLLIPQIPNIKIKYLLLLLNSRIARFIYQYKYHSAKVLRSHLESIPIKILTESDQEYFVQKANELLNKHNSVQMMTEIRNEVDRKLCEIYQLNEEEAKLLFTKLD